MGESLIRHLVYAFIAFTFFIMGTVWLMSSFASTNPNFLDADKFNSFNRSFNKYAELDSSIGGLQDDITQDANPSGESSQFLEKFGFINSLVSTLWNSVKFLFSGFGFMFSAAEGLSEATGLEVPPFVPALIILSITTLIIFGIFTLVFQKDV